MLGFPKDNRPITGKYAKRLTELLLSGELPEEERKILENSYAEDEFSIKEE